MMRALLLPTIWLALGAAMIWGKGQSKSQLIIAGILIGSAGMVVMQVFMPVFMTQVLWAYNTFNYWGFGYFMLIVGGIALLMRWVFERW